MWIKRTVVMLPTEKAMIFKQLGTLFLSKFNESILGDTHSPQHLYILSDEKIKEGDWYYNSDYKTIRQCVEIDKEFIQNALFFEKGSTIFDYSKDCKKIIATTDAELEIKIRENYPNGVFKGVTHLYKFPQPSQAFIEKYIAEYNKGNIITDVMVEYEEYPIIGTTKTIGGNDEIGYKLKTDSKDNTITIRKFHPIALEKSVKEEILHLYDDIREDRKELVALFEKADYIKGSIYKNQIKGIDKALSHFDKLLK